MAAKPQDKALVVCPRCGHQQAESHTAISSNCRQCGEYLRVQELLHPVEKAVAVAVEQRHVTCFDCGAELDVPATAQSAMCKRCSSYLDLKDYAINTAVSKNFKTKGRFVVETKGYVFNTTVLAREIVIKGQVIGKLIAEDSLTKRLIIPAGHSYHAKELLRVGGADFAGEYVGNILAENSVTLRGTGRIFGDVQARHLIVEEGAILVGRMQIGPPP